GGTGGVDLGDDLLGQCLELVIGQLDSRRLWVPEDGAAVVVPRLGLADAEPHKFEGLVAELRVLVPIERASVGPAAHHPVGDLPAVELLIADAGAARFGAAAGVAVVLFGPAEVADALD